MPRPAINRRRQNSFNKFSPKRRGGQPDANAHREYLQKKLAKVAVGGKPDNSDDSDGIVTSRATGRNRKQSEIYASGAVAKGDKPGALPSKAQRTRALRGDTDEIVSQRSRSQSRDRSAVPAQSTPASSLPEKEDDHTRNSVTKRRKIAKPDPKVNGVSPSMQVESSILGPIKPRRRQNSILETIGIGHDNVDLDSSAIHSDDEERFLPDEISTPAQDPQQNTISDAKASTSSLKRKRSVPEMASDASGRSTSSPNSIHNRQVAVPSTQPDLPRPSRTQQRKLSTSKLVSRIDVDVMAPPASSDSEHSANEPEHLPVKTSRTKPSKPTAPSTQQLQNLMPSKRGKPLSVSKPLDEFEIQGDSTTHSEDDAREQEDQSTFSLVRRNKGRNKVSIPPKTKVKGKPKATGAAPKVLKSITKNKAGTKSTRNTPNTPSPTRLRTPLPISSSKPRRSEAKSPSKQDTIMRNKSTNTPLPARATRGVRKRYGGSHHKEMGKENEPMSLSDSPYDSDSGGFEEAKVTEVKGQVSGPEIKAWTKKWGDIDDFELEFEEVSVSTRSSSPNGMAR